MFSSLKTRRFWLTTLVAMGLAVLVVNTAKAATAGTNVPLSFVSSPSEYTVGKIYTYHIRVTNPDAAERKVEIVIILGDAIGGKGGQVRARVLTLTAGESRVIKVRAMAVHGQYGGSFCFQAWSQKLGHPGSSSIITCASPIDK